MAKKYYITTTIPYANAAPHIGFTLEIVQADVLARWKRLEGKEVFFLTGTDEHGVKNYQTAKKEKLSPQKFVDKNSKFFEELTEKFDISNNNFIRTTDKKEHWPGVIQIWNTLKKKGDIYKKEYTGYYCSGCERFITEKDLVDKKCPNHPNLKIELISEENYFFKLSKYSDKIKSLVQSGKLLIYPNAWKNDFLGLISKGLTDVSFSRDKKQLPWGIPVPGDENQVMYVWCDALTNYLTGIGYPNKKYEKYWPADIHAVGKDMLRFHAGIWPGMLLSADLPLPKSIIVHGFLTVNGKKMSKSTGNVVAPLELIKKYSSDNIRYHLIKDFVFGEDGDFSETKLKKALNNELANDLGNLVSRTLTLCEKYFKGKIKKQKDDNLFNKLNLKKIEKYMEKFELHHALEEIWKFVRLSNKYVNDKEPWKNEKDREIVLYNLLESLRFIGILIEPFIPQTSEKINKQLGVKLEKLKDIKFGLQKQYNVKRQGVLFNKIK